METTAKGQADRLKSSYRKLARYRRKMRITGVYWFTWATDYQTGGNPSSMSFRFAGLVRYERRCLHAAAAARHVPEPGGQVRGLPQVLERPLLRPLEARA